jgi:mannose-6-phosphate isomerase
MFGKDIPDGRTGEALEVSALPGLESRAPDGITLPELAARHGAALTGTRAAGIFPLLLKLLDARERLSVQVHPDNAYAEEREGKLGKTEAWLVLKAEPGARLVYGLAPGVDAGRLRRELSRMFDQGAADRIEACFNNVPVHPGDVFYIPAGTVHAIGAGIVLYEIQQSSDVTYRLWDGMRRDANGNARELHIDRALDVIRPSPASAPLAGVTLSDGASARTVYIANERFALERLAVRGAAPQRGDAGSFAMLTALGGCKLAGDGFELSVRPGDTAFIPADAPAFHILGELDVIKAYVPDQDALRVELGADAAGVAGLA